MKILDRINPLCLRFIPKREMISAALFGFCAWTFLLTMTYRFTNLRYDNKNLSELILQIAWVTVYLSIFNLIFLTDYSIKEMLFILFFSGIMLFARRMYGSTGNTNAFVGITVAFSGKHFDKKLFFKVTAFVSLGILLSVIFLNLAGVISSFNYVRGDGRRRYELGFVHPNTLGSFVMSFCFYWLIWRYDQIKWFDHCIFLGGAALCWFAANSRAAALLLFSLPLIVTLMKRFGEVWLNSKGIKVMIFLIYPVMLMLNLAAGFAYNEKSSFFIGLNRLLSDRVRFMHHFLQTTPVTLWGHKIETINGRIAMTKGVSPYILDNNYVRTFLTAGVIPGLLFFLLLSILIYSMARKKKYALVITMAMFALYGCFEERLARLYVNLNLFALPLIFNYEEQDDPETEETLT